MTSITFARPRPMPTTAVRTLGAAVALAALAGCVTAPQERAAPKEAPIVLGPAVRDNVTPMEAVLACYGDHVAATSRPPIVVSVGDVKDYTGKYSINEGNAITQGGALMVYSALGKMGGAVQVAERFDPVIAERELGYADRRQLGDGRSHQLAGPAGNQVVPWLPYFGGSINKSDYFIVGGITELNYNINSGGAEFAVNQVGIKARTFSQSVGVDLRIVDTRTLMILKTISLTKQFNGYEVGFNVFRFFRNDLFDVDVGAKGQEPVQLGIRAALEEAVVRLVAAVTKVDPKPCLGMRVFDELPRQSAESLRKVPNPIVDSSGARVLTGEAVNAASNASSVSTGDGASVQIPFEFGAAALTGGTLNLLDQIAAAAAKAPTEVVLVARDTENWDAGKRDLLTDQRIGVVTSALISRGIAPGGISVSWRPDKADTAIHRDGPGLQEVAKLRVQGAGSGKGGPVQPAREENTRRGS
ncbi:CsgG/HfaB family protein [Variovorax sp. PDC80]|uniref:CsgG/HfaB family protein n=1 Tax=Variovorax sp. PDC80 TaxID=1882827 RepID=UPI000B85205A|nr:CsgG/HfaB family protein [Variovorax sp. PDC80]